MGYNPWGHKRVRHDLVTKRQQQKGEYTDINFTLENLEKIEIYIENNFKVS